MTTVDLRVLPAFMGGVGFVIGLPGDRGVAVLGSLFRRRLGECRDTPTIRNRDQAT